MLTRFANEVLDEVLLALSLDECELPPEAPVYEPVCDGCASEEPVVFLGGDEAAPCWFEDGGDHEPAGDFPFEAAEDRLTVRQFRL